MKRIGIFVSLLFLLFSSPVLVFARFEAAASVVALNADLPWSTLDAVFKKVAAQGKYSYSQLVAWFDAGLLTVEQSGSSYVVRIFGSDGGMDILVIEDL